mgnify:CR=1 FL=1
MTVTVAAKNYTIISGCEISTDNGTWLILTTQDGDSKKQGSYSLCGIVKNAGDNIVTFTPTTSKDLSGVKHVRFWFLSTHGGLLNTYELNGLNFWASDGTNTGYWKILGKTKDGKADYPGGWINCVIDVSKACDSGTKPTNMNAITSMGIRINLTVAGKNAINTWIDHLCMCDGLVAYGDDAGGYFDIDDIFTADDATTLGVGIVRKIGGQYFLAGSLEIGYATSATKFQTKSSVLVFENRRVNDALYGITVVDSGNVSYTTEFILGSKAGTAGIEGCMLRVQDPAQTCKYVIDGVTDIDVDNFKLYGTTFYDAAALKFPTAAAAVEVLNCNFESCDDVQTTTCVIKNCNFVSANDEGLVLPSGDTHQMTYCTFVNCPYGVRIPTAGTYSFNNLKFVNNTIDIDNTSGGLVTVNCTDSNPVTYTGNTVINSPRYFTITGLVAGSEVRIYKTSDMSELAGVESSGTSFQYPYNYTGDIPITYAVFHVQYTAIYRTDTLVDANKSVPAFQVYDRTYSNP